MALLHDEGLAHTLTLVGHFAAAAVARPSAMFQGENSAVWQTWNTLAGTQKTGRPARERATLMRVIELWLVHLRAYLRGEPGLPGIQGPRSRAHAQHLARVLTQAHARVQQNASPRLLTEASLLEMQLHAP